MIFSNMLIQRGAGEIILPPVMAKPRGALDALRIGHVWSPLPFFVSVPHVLGTWCLFVYRAVGSSSPSFGREAPVTEMDRDLSCREFPVSPIKAGTVF